MFKHEDFPCCGCGPEGCIDHTRTVQCAQCGQRYHPDPQTGVYCYRCLNAPRYRYTPPKRMAAKPNTCCEECLHWAGRDQRRGVHGPIDLSAVPEATVTFGNGDLCDDCARDAEDEDRAGWETDAAEGWIDEYDDR